jgi:hypothetical protein
MKDMSLSSVNSPIDSAVGSQPNPKNICSAFRWVVAACVVIAVGSRLSFLGDPFKNDAGIYIYLGKVLWEGGKLYSDFWETKFPSVPLIMAPLYAVFGAHWFGYVLVQAAMGIAGAWILARALCRYVASETYVPALLFGLIGLNVSRLTITGFQLETVQMFFEILAAWLVLRSLARRDSMMAAFGAGLFASVAMMAKPTGLSVCAAAACAYLWEARELGARRTAIRIGTLASGMLIPLIGVFAWVQSSSFRGEMPVLIREIRLYASGTPWRSLLQFKTWIFFVLPFAPAVLRMAIVRILGDARETPVADDATKAPPQTAAVFALAWAVIEVAAVLVQRRLYGYHFLVLVPPAVVIFALWPRSQRLGPIIAAIAPVAAISIYFSITQGYRALANGGGSLSPVSRYVIDHTAPADAVWADPAARLLLETDRRPGSRLQMTFYLVNHDDAPKYFGDILLDDFEQRAVKYLILPVGWRDETRRVAQETPGTMWRPKRRAAYIAAMARIDWYVKEHYQLEATIDGKFVYRRISGAAK